MKDNHGQEWRARSRVSPVGPSHSSGDRKANRYPAMREPGCVTEVQENAASL